MNRKLRAETNDTAIIQQLATADGCVVNYKGFHALLRLEPGVQCEKQPTIHGIELEFVDAKSHRMANGTFPSLLKLLFRDAGNGDGLKS